MAIAVAFLIFAGALALSAWVIHATMSEKRAVIVALLKGEPDPRFAAAEAVRAVPRPSPVSLRYPVRAAERPTAKWRAAA